MNYFIKVRRVIKNNIIKIVAPLIYFVNIYILKDTHDVASVKETIEKALLKKASIVRFGDGEITLMNGGSINFQKRNALLQKKLISIANSEEKNLLICIPDALSVMRNYNRDEKIYWQKHLIKNRKIWKMFFDKKQKYYNAFITRFYGVYQDETQNELLFELVKKIWKNRSIVIVEGKESRLGINNDLFNGAEKIERVICPSKNAFDKYDEIYKTIKEINKNKLILISLGPTAKPLVYHLHKDGYQVIDVGHIDITYEWFLMGATVKTAIKNKRVNEVDSESVIGECLDKKYLSEIIKIIY